MPAAVLSLALVLTMALGLLHAAGATEPADRIKAHAEAMYMRCYGCMPRNMGGGCVVFPPA